MNNTIFCLGLILLLGLFSSKLIRYLRMPSVTAYLFLGIITGPYLLNFISKDIILSSGLITNIALGFVAFNLGQNFSSENFKKLGKPILWISIGEVLGAFFLVSFSIWFFLKQPLYVAILFGAIAPATAPAAILMVVREYKAKGEFTNTLLGVVAIDDAWGLMLFAFCLAIAKSLAGINASSGLFHSLVAVPLLEISGALILGFFIALLFSFISKYVTNQTDLLIFVLGFILLNSGLAIHFKLSVLLTNMFLGAILININKVSFRLFESLRTVDSVVYLLFFVLAGASLNIKLFSKIGILGAVYVITRLPGEMLGAAIGAKIGNASRVIRNFIGFGLAPQAGVALALALTAKASFPVYGDLILTTIIGTTIVYEIIGPILTKYALQKAGDIT